MKPFLDRVMERLRNANADEVWYRPTISDDEMFRNITGRGFDLAILAEVGQTLDRIESKLK